MATTSATSSKVSTAESDSSDVTYTLFASGLNYGGRDVDLKNKDTTTNLAIVFDVVEQHTYTRPAKKTSYSTEDKVTYSDHVVIEDGKFSFSARIGSAPVKILKNNYIDKDTDTSNYVGSKRPEKALTALITLFESRQIVTLVTEDIILENYVMTNMEAARNNSDGAALVFNFEFEEFRTFTANATTVYTSAKKTSNKSKGSVSSSSTSDEQEVWANRSIYSDTGTGSKSVYDSLSDSLGLDYKTDQVVGTLSADGTLTDTSGNKTTYSSLVNQ